MKQYDIGDIHRDRILYQRAAELASIIEVLNQQVRSLQQENAEIKKRLAEQTAAAGQ